MPSLLVLFASFTYAIFRYHILKGVAWEELPLFISNKAIALAAVIFISFSYALGSLARFFPKSFTPFLDRRKHFGLMGFGLAAIHIAFSLLLFSPAYYPKFFTQTGTLTLVGSLSMLFGVLAFFVFSFVAYTSIPAVAKEMDEKKWRNMQSKGYIGCLLVLSHVVVMGLDGWMKPAGWPGGLLPISLVAAIILLLMLLLKILATTFARH